VPSLNERKEDIPLLVEYFSEQLSQQLKVPQKTFDKKAIEYLQKLDYTGNVRQLKNWIERIYVLCDSNVISVKDVEQNCYEHF
jgi:DNA-binding NtrC family response regulator